jgi:outer membrane protein OmpA-like peptidoglycan-associated protein
MKTPSRTGNYLAMAAMLGATVALFACTTAREDSASRKLIVSTTACADFSFSIYFDRRSTHLNHEADDLLAAAAARTHDCEVKGIEVIGLADQPGSPEINAELSRARTKVVTRALKRHGFADFRFAPTKETSDTQTTTAVASPFRRRVEVNFHFVPKS